MATVLVVMGTRPEAIKLAPVVLRMRESGSLDPLVVSTAQHGEVVHDMLAAFDLTADLDLDVLRRGDDLTRVTTRTLDRMADLLEDRRPDAVIVQGDTTAAFAGALAAFQTGCRTLHVESGLRTGDRQRPFPEEMNRRLIGQIADVHCAPTARARRNLLAEGVNPSTVHVTGNTVVDALQLLLGREVTGQGASNDRNDRPVVVTLHRRENWGRALSVLAQELRRLASKHREVAWVVPMHPNPSVRETLGRILGGLPNVELTESLGYVDFIRLVRGARFVLTDSGGIQEEAPSLGIPVLVLRERTERPEVLDTGLVRLVGTDPDAVGVAVVEALQADTGEAPRPTDNPVGDGRAAVRVEQAVAHMLGLGMPPSDFVAREPARVRDVSDSGSISVGGGSGS